MKGKELKRMSRVELIEIIAAQKKRELELEEQLRAAEQLLQERTIKKERAGSIAEAALSLNDVFAAAQAAADDYVQSLQTAWEDIAQSKARAQEECARMLAETEEQCRRMLTEAKS